MQGFLNNYFIIIWIFHYLNILYNSPLLCTYISEKVIAFSLSWVLREREMLALTPTRLALTPTRLALTPTRLALTPTRLALTPTRLASIVGHEKRNKETACTEQ